MTEPTPKILCVDDEPAILELLEDYLTRQGFSVVTASNGVQALFQVQRHLPRAVILDLFMPRLGGLGALDRIRRLVPGIVVILISGLPNVLEIVTEAGVSVAGAFAKPVDLPGILGTLVEAGVMPSRMPEAAASEATIQAGSRGRRRILVVDDEGGVRDMLIEYLEGRGFEARGASDGQETLHLLPDFRPHVILLDITMPGLSGVETLRRIKALSLEVCVVMISGIADVDTARQTLAMGAADYMTKPINFQYLDRVLDVHLLMAESNPELA